MGLVEHSEEGSSMGSSQGWLKLEEHGVNDEGGVSDIKV